MRHTRTDMDEQDKPEIGEGAPTRRDRARGRRGPRPERHRHHPGRRRERARADRRSRRAGARWRRAGRGTSGRAPASGASAGWAQQPLPFLYDVHPEARPARPVEVGLQTIDIDQIAGTAVGGGAQRGGDFLPLKPFRGGNWTGRWQRLRKAQDRLVVLPPIDVVKYGDRYWVVDGHNRVGLALYGGQAAIDADVTELVPRGRPADRADRVAGQLVCRVARAPDRRQWPASERRPGTRGHRPDRTSRTATDDADAVGRVARSAAVRGPRRRADPAAGRRRTCPIPRSSTRPTGTASGRSTRSSGAAISSPVISASSATRSACAGRLRSRQSRSRRAVGRVGGRARPEHLRQRPSRRDRRHHRRAVRVARAQARARPSATRRARGWTSSGSRRVSSGAG